MFGVKRVEFVVRFFLLLCVACCSLFVFVCCCLMFGVCCKFVIVCRLSLVVLLFVG